MHTQSHGLIKIPAEQGIMKSTLRSPRPNGIHWATTIGQQKGSRSFVAVHKPSHASILHTHCNSPCSCKKIPHHFFSQPPCASVRNHQG